MRDIEMLRGATRDAHRNRRADVAELRLERAGIVEHLDALIARVGDIDIALRVEGDRLDAAELSGTITRRAPVREELAVFVELGDAIVIADAVGDVDIAGAIPRHVRRTTEAGSGNTCSCVRPAGTLTATAASNGATTGSCARTGARARGTGATCRARTRSSTSGGTGTSAATTSGRRPHADRLRLTPEHQTDAAISIELHDLVGRRVDRPDVVLRIDPQPDRRVEAVDILAPLPHELAVSVEHEQFRAAVRERPVVA